MFTGLVTRDNAAFHAGLAARIADAGLQDRVRFLGELPWDQVVLHYQALDLFCAPARWEGFGLTPLEAMASGARCISTSCAPMPEFFAEQALYYAASDSSALATHINTVVGTPTVEAMQHRLGVQQRAGVFTWDDTLRGVVRELKSTLEGRVLHEQKPALARGT